MSPVDVFAKVLGARIHAQPVTTSVFVHAPANIALCKYWGKRDVILNLPVTSSLSLSLVRGCSLKLTLAAANQDVIVLDGQPVLRDSAFASRFSGYLDCLRALQAKKYYFNAEISTEIPIGAGLASSACGFASLVLALNEIFAFNLSEVEQSILARMGSGSACRSLWKGFVEWEKGISPDGMDSHGVPLAGTWPELCLGLLILSRSAKPVSSRLAMQRTVETSVFYQQWPEKVAEDLALLKSAIEKKDFALLGATAEANALAMHALMLTANPAVVYFLPETMAAMHQIWQMRAAGLPVYFTQDAGPSLKLLFQAKDRDVVQQHFPGLEVISPFLSLN